MKIVPRMYNKGKNIYDISDVKIIAKNDKRTDHKCNRCGAFLYETDKDRIVEQKAKEVMGNPRQSKRSRLRKKFQKKYEFALKTAELLVYCTNEHIPSYICLQCGRLETNSSLLRMELVKIREIVERRKEGI